MQLILSMFDQSDNLLLVLASLNAASAYGRAIVSASAIDYSSALIFLSNSA